MYLPYYNYDAVDKEQKVLDFADDIRVQVHSGKLNFDCRFPAACLPTVRAKSMD